MKTDFEKCLQETFAPNNRCFGCGPANEKGLRIQSFPMHNSIPTDDPASFELIATWQPEKHHEAFDNMLNGGIVGALLDCHCNWAAAYHMMLRDSLNSPPCTVTANYEITLKAPTRTDGPVELMAKVDSCSGRRTTVKGFLQSEGTVTAECTGMFVAVKEGHPAYHRW